MPCAVHLCSRVKSLDGLRIMGGIAPQALRADPAVVAFYKALRHRQLTALGLDPAQFQTIY